MSVQRWKPSWAQGRMIPAGVHPVDGYVSAADHARVVAEMERAHAAALADANLRWDAEVTRALDEGEKIGRADAEQAHAAALAEERQRVLSMRFTEFMAAIKKSCPCICHEYTRDINPHDGKCVCNGGDGMETLGVAAPRTLTADDPEPAVGSVVLFDGLPYIRQGNKWVAPRANIAYWYEFMRDERPTVLIHDGEDRYSRLGREASETMTAMDARRAAIHDGEATPQDEPDWDKPYEQQTDTVKTGLAKIARVALEHGAGDNTVCPTCGYDYAPFRYCPNDHRGMVDKGYTNEAAVPRLPRTLTADDPLQAVVLHVAAELVRHQGMADERPDQVDPFLRAMATQLKGALDRSRALIHDGEDR